MNALFTPPTDNLYKFVALSGVTMALFSLYWIFSVWENHSRETHEVLLMHARLDADLASRERTLGRYIEVVDATTNAAAMKVLTELMMPDAIKAAAVLPEMAAQQGEVRYRAERLGAIHRSARNKTAAVFVPLVVGVVLAWWGFTRWYRRVQVFQDRITRKEASLRAAKLTSAVSPALAGVRLIDGTFRSATVRTELMKGCQ